MKRFCALFTLLVVLFGCKKVANSVTVEGEIEGITTDTLLLYGNDELSDFVVELPVANGKFSQSIPVDTLIQAMLIFNGQQVYPLYLDRGEKITIKGSSERSLLEVSGNRLNEQLTSFYAGMHDLSDSIVTLKADTFIRNNQTSLVSLYLLDRYFVQNDSLNSSLVKELIATMDGMLQDKPYIGRINKLMEEKEKIVVGRIAPVFNLTDQKGEKVSRSDFRNKVLLLNFWASWTDSCSNGNAELKKIYRTHYKNGKKRTKKEEEESKFSMLGISLDIDKEDWRNAIAADTLEWRQACDFNGWESQVVKQYSVQRIPYTLLIGADNKIVACNLQGEELLNKIDELVEKEIEKEKKKKKQR